MCRSIEHYRPRNTRELLERLVKNDSPGARLLCELLFDREPLFFLAQVEKAYQVRKQEEQQARNSRREEITEAYRRLAKRAVQLLERHVMSSPESGVALLAYLENRIRAQDIGSLGGVLHAPFWREPEHRRAVQQELNNHIFYAVLLILQETESADEPEAFTVPLAAAESLLALVASTISTVMEGVATKVMAGTFYCKSQCFGNRGDRVTDRSLFLRRPPRSRGLYRMLNGVSDLGRNLPQTMGIKS
ncbi:hypothetical protein [Sulfidibacter corallicola]|uniref:Uncharacterized protein n=1 Tax=Sulfidibacter corallicola TaxID=2818388 RepID=A0A8A4TTT3_SULCO|nr:hypothetical protein [Sulfidibacter corallicola]QTD53369.1 hypothetical protein J3U87_13020 [Sulfidibacter corallicola]